jgi:hypothetical protein
MIPHIRTIRPHKAKSRKNPRQLGSHTLLPNIISGVADMVKGHWVGYE